MVLGVQSDEYLWDPAFRTLAGIRAGKFTLETVLNAAAYVATWCREQFGERGVDGAVGMDEVLKAKAKARGVRTSVLVREALARYLDAS
jgi:sugar (pentulose or hexulose) kinase